MFRRALEINPAYTEAALNLAVTYNDLGKYREAKEVYQRALAASKNAPRSLDPFAKGKIANMHADIGAAYHAVGMYADAVREYQRALALCPTFVDIRTRLGTTLREMGDAAEAVREFERVRAENPRFLRRACTSASATTRRAAARTPCPSGGPCSRWRPTTSPPRCTSRCSTDGHDGLLTFRSFARVASSSRRSPPTRPRARASTRSCGSRSAASRRWTPSRRLARLLDVDPRDVGYAGPQGSTRGHAAVDERAARRPGARAPGLRARSRRARGDPARQQAAHGPPARAIASSSSWACRSRVRPTPRRETRSRRCGRGSRHSRRRGCPTASASSASAPPGDNAAVGLALLRGERRERPPPAQAHAVGRAVRRLQPLPRPARGAVGRPPACSPATCCRRSRRAGSSSPRTSPSTSGASTPASSSRRGPCRAAARRSRRPGRRRAPSRTRPSPPWARRARTSRARPRPAGRAPSRARAAHARRPRRATRTRARGSRRGGGAPALHLASGQLRHRHRRRAGVIRRVSTTEFPC